MRNIVCGNWMRPVPTKLVAMLDYVTVECEKDDVAIVAAEDVVISASNLASKRSKSFKTFDRRCSDVDS